VTNASANTNAHHPHTPAGIAETGGARRLDAVHSHSGDDRAHGAGDSERSSLEFLTSVRTLKEAEKSAAQKVEESKKEAAKVEAQAREKAVEMQAKASEKAVAAKNELLAEGKRKADAEIKEILSEAQKQAAKMRAKRLAEKDVLAISEHVL